jgi:hypothetical protein
MESPASPIVQPINPPPAPPHFNHLKIAFLILIAIILSVSLTAIFFLKIYSSSPTPTQTPMPQPTPETTPTLSPSNTPIPTTIITPTPTIAPTPTPAPIISQSSTCDVPDTSLCRVISDLKTALTNKDYNGFLAYQNIESTTCNPDGMFVSVCEGAAKGVIKQGYQIGYNQSEGTMVTKADYLQTVSAYVNNNSPLNYQGTVFQGNKATIVFLNPNKDHLLLFPLKRSGTSWVMDFVLVGGTFGDNSFANLSNSLLDFVQ